MLTVSKDNPEKAYDYTSKGHLVGVVSNGTAVLGLGFFFDRSSFAFLYPGNIGALASKPVMEGKAVLFKTFGGLDSFDIELNQPDPEKFIEAVSILVLYIQMLTLGCRSRSNFWWNQYRGCESARMLFY